ncbi:MAG TPA: DUF1206 domain-containing protein [Chthoniobacterales bacterium]
MKENRWIVRVGRIGYVAKGLVFICIGLISASAALGGNVGATDFRGVMQAILQQPFGGALLIVLIAGLVCYVLWLLLASFVNAGDVGNDAKGITARVRALFLAVIYSSIIAIAVKAFAGKTSGGGDDRAAQSWTATALARPFGSTLVIVIGAAIMVGGLLECLRAYREKFAEQLDLTGFSKTTQKWIVRFCAFGFAARGVVFVVLGALVMQSGWQSDPTKARGMSGALDAVIAQPFGRSLFAVGAIGLAAYGIYCCVKARYGRIGE